jgi:hypothetical protein
MTKVEHDATLSGDGTIASPLIVVGGGHIIEDEGVALTQRAKLNFVGAGVTVTDGGAITDDTIVTINAIGSGTVTKVSVTTANGVSGTVATDTTTPAISLTLGNITPTSVSLSAGTVSQFPLKFTAGTNLSTVQVGAMEFDGTDLYITI